MIQRPAQTVGVELNAKFVADLASDAATIGSLPLVAYWLAQHWDALRNDGYGGISSQALASAINETGNRALNGDAAASGQQTSVRSADVTAEVDRTLLRLIRQATTLREVRENAAALAAFPFHEKKADAARREATSGLAERAGARQLGVAARLLRAEAGVADPASGARAGAGLPRLRHFRDTEDLWAEALTPDGNYLVTTTKKFTLTLWRIADGRRLASATGGAVSSVLCDEACSTIVILAGATQSLHAASSAFVWKEGGTQLLRLPAPDVRHAALAPDGARLFLVKANGDTELFDTSGAGPLHGSLKSWTAAKHERVIFNGTEALLSSSSGRASFVALETGRERELRSDVFLSSGANVSVRVHATGQWQTLAVPGSPIAVRGGLDESLRVVSLDPGSRTLALHLGAAHPRRVLLSTAPTYVDEDAISWTDEELVLRTDATIRVFDGVTGMPRTPRMTRERTGLSPGARQRQLAGQAGGEFCIWTGTLHCAALVASLGDVGPAQLSRLSDTRIRVATKTADQVAVTYELDLSPAAMSPAWVGDDVVPIGTTAADLVIVHTPSPGGAAEVKTSTGSLIVEMPSPFGRTEPTRRDWAAWEAETSERMDVARPSLTTAYHRPRTVDALAIVRGRRIAVVGSDARLLMTWDTPRAPVSVAFSDDGQHIAAAWNTAKGMGRVALRQLGESKDATVIEASASVYDVASFGAGPSIAVLQGEGSRRQLAIWRDGRWELGPILPDGEWLLRGVNREGSRLLLARTSSATLQSNRGDVICPRLTLGPLAAMSDDGRRLATVVRNSLLLYDVVRCRQLEAFFLHDELGIGRIEAELEFLASRHDAVVRTAKGFAWVRESTNADRLLLRADLVQGRHAGRPALDPEECLQLLTLTDRQTKIANRFCPPQATTSPNESLAAVSCALRASIDPDWRVDGPSENALMAAPDGPCPSIGPE